MNGDPQCEVRSGWALVREKTGAKLELSVDFDGGRNVSVVNSGQANGDVIYTQLLYVRTNMLVAVSRSVVLDPNRVTASRQRLSEATPPVTIAPCDFYRGNVSVGNRRTLVA